MSSTRDTPDGQLKLVPRLKAQGYAPPLVERRRRWVETQTGADLALVGRHSLDTEAMRGNIENPIGAIQMPLGVAGPLILDGEHARGTFYVPLATTEGALVRSYERGMFALSRAGGVTTRVSRDENRIAPVFQFPDVARAHEFSARMPDHVDALRAEVAATTSHGTLLGVECQPVGRSVIATLCFSTGDAHGMNMIAKAAERVCAWLVANGPASHYFLFSGLASEKRVSGALFAGGKGKKVTAGALVPAAVVTSVVHATPAEIHELWQQTILGNLQANAVGYNGHIANGLTALFIACGQDVANVVNSSVGVTNFEVTPTGDLYASLTLPSLTVATVGGGCLKGTSRECLEILGCVGSDRALKLAEIVAASLLAGELSMAGAIASGEFVAAHETYGRNRPTSGT